MRLRFKARKFMLDAERARINQENAARGVQGAWIRAECRRALLARFRARRFMLVAAAEHRKEDWASRQIGAAERHRVERRELMKLFGIRKQAGRVDLILCSPRLSSG